MYFQLLLHFIFGFVFSNLFFLSYVWSVLTLLKKGVETGVPGVKPPRTKYRVGQVDIWFSTIYCCSRHLVDQSSQERLLVDQLIVRWLIRPVVGSPADSLRVCLVDTSGISCHWSAQLPPQKVGIIHPGPDDWCGLYCDCQRGLVATNTGPGTGALRRSHPIAVACQVAVPQKVWMDLLMEKICVLPHAMSSALQRPGLLW